MPTTELNAIARVMDRIAGRWQTVIRRATLILLTIPLAFALYLTGLFGLIGDALKPKPVVTSTKGLIAVFVAEGWCREATSSVGVIVTGNFRVEEYIYFRDGQKLDHKTIRVRQNIEVNEATVLIFDEAGNKESEASADTVDFDIPSVEVYVKDGSEVKEGTFDFHAVAERDEDYESSMDCKLTLRPHPPS